MSERYFMGIDIGTYESKGVITDGRANVVAEHACPHRMEAPRPGWAEHDADGVWWKDLCEISNALMEKSKLLPESVEALAVSTIAPCCLPVDECGRPLRKAILYGVDVRAAEEIRYLEGRIGRESINEKYGMPITSQSAGAKVLWIKNNEPEIYEKTYKFVTGSTYLVSKLTGRYVVDRYTAVSWIPLYDVAGEDWDEDLNGICRRDQLADCMWTGEIAGEVTREAAVLTGLAAGTKVTVGTADAAAEAVSVGVTSPGDMMIIYGSSIFMIHVVKEFTRDDRLSTGPYLFPGTYAVTAGMSCGGTLTRWFRDKLAGDIVARAEAEGRNAYGDLAEMIEDVPPGSEGLIVLPYFSGERSPINDPDAKGVIFGLNLLHGREHIYNACIEGIGYGISQHFDIFKERGIETRRVMSAGGGVKNRKWITAVSDISGEVQQIAISGSGAAFGDALLAALAVGHYNSIDEISGMIEVREKIEPDPERHRVYAPIKDRYSRLYQATRDIMHEK